MENMQKFLNTIQKIRLEIHTDFLGLQKMLETLKLIFISNIEGSKQIYQVEIKKRDEIIDNLKTRINVLESKSAINDIEMEHLRLKVDDNEQYSRRHSLRLIGMEKKKFKETPEEILQEVYKEMDHLDAPIDEQEIDRAHRSGLKYKDDYGKWQQPVLLKFNSWDARNRMYRLRKYSHFYMKADLTVRKEHVFNYAKEEIRKKDSLANKLINYVFVDANSTLMAFTVTGRFLSFNTEAEFNSIMLYIDNTTESSVKVYDIIEQGWASSHPGE